MERQREREQDASGKFIGDVGRVVTAGQALLHGLEDLGFDDLRLLTAREKERYMEFAVECAPGDSEALLNSRYDLGRRLGCAVDCEVAGGTVVQLKLSRFQRWAGLLLARDTGGLPPLFVPVGGAENGFYYLNLAGTGSVGLGGSSSEVASLSRSHMRPKTRRSALPCLRSACWAVSGWNAPGKR